MKLYYCETTNPRKVCAVAKHLGMPVDYERVDLFAGAQNEPGFEAINPNRKVPVLIDDEARIFESAAIMMYLAQKAGSNLWPATPGEQVQVIQWLAWDSAHLSRHASTVYFEHVIKKLASIGEPDPAAVEEAVGFFNQFAAVLDAHLSDRTYLVGDNLTIADFGTACVMTVAKENNLDQLPIDRFTNIVRWLGMLNDIPAWKNPWPVNA